MTGRTHDLAAFTALSYMVATNPVPSMTLATMVVAFSANMIGGLAPDIDQPTADLWHKLPAGGVFAKLLTPLLGGHRFISHSVLGVVLFGVVLDRLLMAIKTVLLVDMTVVWLAFMIGFVSHLIMDTFTREGVPWLFPIPIRFGIPPFRFMRVQTGGMLEKSFIFPGLMIANFYIYYTYHDTFLHFLKQLIK